MDGVDPAPVWAYVADPGNLDQWAPTRRSGYMGTELPSVGHTLFLHRHRSDDPDEAWRCRIEEWEAGRRVRCLLETPGAAQDQSVEVIVETEGSGARPAAAIRIVYAGDVPAFAAVLYRWRIGAMLRRSIRKIQAAVGRS